MTNILLIVGDVGEFPFLFSHTYALSTIMFALLKKFLKTDTLDGVSFLLASVIFSLFLLETTWYFTFSYD